MNKVIQSVLILVLAWTDIASSTHDTCSGSYNATDTSGGVNWNATWTVSDDLEYVTFTVMATTDGWLAIGFSFDQEMPNTDVVVGAADSNGSNSYVSDRYATARSAPPVDDSQDFMDYNAQQIISNDGTHTIITFTRPVYSYDAFDLNLDHDVFILYAWGLENNFNWDDPESIAFHGTGYGFSPDPITILCPGSCVTVGYNGCCFTGSCLGSDGQCYCDQECQSFGDCCPDILDINCFPVSAGSGTTSGTSSGGDDGTTGTIVAIVVSTVFGGLILLSCCIAVGMIVWWYVSKSKKSGQRTQQEEMEQISNTTTITIPITVQAPPPAYAEQTPTSHPQQPVGYPAQYLSQPEAAYSTQEYPACVYPDQAEGGVYPDQAAMLYPVDAGKQATAPPPPINPEFHQAAPPPYGDVLADSKAPYPAGTKY